MLESHSRCWEWTLGPLQGQQMFFTAEPSLHNPFPQQLFITFVSVFVLLCLHSSAMAHMRTEDGLKDSVFSLHCVGSRD